MRPLRLSSCLRSVGVSAAVTLTPAGCTDWRVYTVEPAQVIEHARPDQVRIYRREQPRLLVTQPRVAGDSITGLVGRAPFQVAVADVTAVGVRRVDWVETALLLAAPPAILFGLACLAACGGY